MIPVIPLTLLSAHLLTKSADYLIIPGIDEALEASLETLKIQIENKGKLFTDKFSSRDNIPLSYLNEHNIDFAGQYYLKKDSIICLDKKRLKISILAADWSPSKRSMLNAVKTGKTSQLIITADQGMLIYYHSINDSNLTVAAYQVNRRIVEVKNQLMHSLRIYSTLSLIKESIIQKNLIWSLAALIIFGLSILSISIAKKLSGTITKPVQNLVKGMDRISNGNLNKPVQAEGKDEFRYMIKTFNNMMADLRKTRKKLVEAEKMAAWRDSARMVSHEIRNSLTPISLSLHRLRNKTSTNLDSKSFRDSIDTINDELTSLKNMASEFSEFAKMPQPHKSEVDINEIIKAVVDLKQAVAGNVQLKTELDPSLAPVKVDREQIRQVLNNLIQNSIDASHNYGHVKIISCKSKDSKYNLEIIIKDDGAGLTPEFQKKIFTPYYTTKKRGTGLGLPIVKRIIDEHNGTIAVESKSKKGSTFYINL